MKSFDIRTTIHFGDHALDRLVDIPYRRVMIITDPYVVQSGMIGMITSGSRRAARNLKFSRRLCRIRRLRRLRSAFRRS